MPKRRGNPTASPLLLQVMAALGRLEVREVYLAPDHPGEVIHGQETGGLIEINPVPSIVDTVIHECIHAIRPSWTESSVKRQTSRLVNRLSGPQMKAIYEEYQKKVDG